MYVALSRMMNVRIITLTYSKGHVYFLTNKEQYVCFLRIKHNDMVLSFPLNYLLCFLALLVTTFFFQYLLSNQLTFSVPDELFFFAKMHKNELFLI